MEQWENAAHDRLVSLVMTAAGFAAVTLIVLVMGLFARGSAAASAHAFHNQAAQASANAATDDSAEPGEGAAAPSEGAEDAASEASAAGSEGAAGESDDDRAPDYETLAGILGEEDAAKLLASAETSEDARWIAAHPDRYGIDGEQVQWKMLKLAADEPAAIDYVREFPDEYPADGPRTDAQLAVDGSGATDAEGVPHLYQWDRRWGHTVYSSAPFGLSGCGPTCMAMVYQALSGNDDLSPYDMGVRADEGGFMDEYLGTDVGFFFSQAEQLGLACQPLDIDGGSIRWALENGYLVIANLGVGYFTQFGHFFVLAGIADDGTVIVNDPYSRERSLQTWDADFLAGESVALLAFSR